MGMRASDLSPDVQRLMDRAQANGSTLVEEAMKVVGEERDRLKAEMERELSLKAKLAAKIAKTTRDIPRVPKAGRNTSQNYSFTQESDVVKAVSEHASVNGIAVVFEPFGESVDEPIGASSGSKGLLTRARVKLSLIDTETGFERESVWEGRATDYPGDKAIYKALTGAKKYALMLTFGIATGADPETTEQEVDGDGNPIRQSSRGDQQQQRRRSSGDGGGNGNTKPVAISDEPRSVKEQQLAGIEKIVKSVGDFTEAEVQNFIHEVLTALPIPEGGKAPKSRTELSERQAGMFIESFQKELRKARERRKATGGSAPAQQQAPATDAQPNTAAS